MPLQAYFSPETWFTSDTPDLVLIGDNSVVQNNPQYESIEQLIIRLSKEYGVSPTLSLALAKCESGLGPNRVGDLRRGVSRGLWQINKKYHPYITDEQAFSVEWSTHWSLEKIANGQAYLWSCYKSMLK